MLDKEKFLYIGNCDSYSDDWINFNVNSVEKNVISYNFSFGIPFSDKTFDVIYCNYDKNLFLNNNVEYFIQECFRVLKPFGGLRLSFFSSNIIQISLIKNYFEKIKYESMGKSDNEILSKYCFLFERKKDFEEKIYLECIKLDEKKEELEKENLKVLMFNTYDFGGAAIAALRQNDALRKIGISSECYLGLQKHIRNGAHLLPSFGDKIISAGGNDLMLEKLKESSNVNKIKKDKLNLNILTGEFFSLFDGAVSFKDIPFIKDYDIINFEWISGLLDFSDVDIIRDKPIVWTLHDTNCFTGGCHYTSECKNFENSCGTCHQLSSKNISDISHTIHTLKQIVYKKLNLHIVTPSNWLASEAKKSSLLKDIPIHVIKYAQPTNLFRPLNRISLRHAIDIKDDEIALLFSAVDLNNGRKGGKYLLDLLLSLRNKDISKKIVCLLLGDNVPAEFLNVGIRAIPFGHVFDEKTIVAIYNMADGLLVPSLEDNLPNVICESHCSGTPVVAFNSGGIPEMIIHKENGFLCESKNISELEDGVFWITENKYNLKIRENCREFALKNYDEETQAKKYEVLYKNLLNKKDSNETIFLNSNYKNNESKGLELLL